MQLDPMSILLLVQWLHTPQQPHALRGWKPVLDTPHALTRLRACGSARMDDQVCIGRWMRYPGYVKVVA